MQPVVNLAWCKACGLCIAFCPRDVFTAAADGRPLVTRPDACIACGLCDYRCPDFAITLAENKVGV
ncbi:MAG: 4Fe-4S binding protein [Firmicutes bacterium]|nr:4Fe-4S binding protein [Bacillota bacterium]